MATNTCFNRARRSAYTINGTIAATDSTTVGR